jgi:hypothetical protein
MVQSPDVDAESQLERQGLGTACENLHIGRFRHTTRASSIGPMITTWGSHESQPLLLRARRDQFQVWCSCEWQ